MSAISPPIDEHPKHQNTFSKVLALSLIFSFTTCYYSISLYLNSFITIVDAIILLIAGILSAKASMSFSRSPLQFFTALLERLWIPIAWILALGVRYIGLILSLLLRIARIVFCLGVAVIYDVSPIDLIPDFIIGFGQVDDIVFTIVMIYFAFFGGRLIIAVGAKNLAREIIASSKPKTAFP